MPQAQENRQDQKGSCIEREPARILRSHESVQHDQHGEQGRKTDGERTEPARGREDERYGDGRQGLGRH